MTLLFLSLALGALFGFLIRTKPRIMTAGGYLLNTSIYVLILVLGVSVGANDTVMGNLGYLGVQALWISVTAIVGSACALNILDRFLWKDRSREG